MAVSLFYGMTQSGKTHLAMLLVEKFNRSVIYDFTGKINVPGSFITSDFSQSGMVKIFSKFKDSKKFCIIFRPGRVIDHEIFFNKVAVFALTLGRQEVKRGGDEKLVFLTDEVDFVCTAGYQSPQLKEVVNVGRHDLVDSWFIARMPQRIHTDARGNASTIYCFRLVDDSALGYIKRAIGKNASNKIKELEQYSFLCWKDTGEYLIFNRDQKLIESWR